MDYANFKHLMEVQQQRINILHINGWFNNCQCNKEISYIPMGGSLIINVLVYTQNSGEPVTSLIYFKTNICDSPENPSDGFVVDYVFLTYLLIH